MAEHIWSILCYKGVLDTYTNQVSILDAIESVAIRGPNPDLRTGPAMIPMALSVVSLWRRSERDVPEKFAARVVVLAPDDGTFTTNEIELDLSAFLRGRTFMKLEALPFRGAGEYRFVMETRHGQGTDEPWERVASLPLDVAFEDETSQQPGVGATPTQRGTKRKRPASASPAALKRAAHGRLRSDAH